MARIAGVNVPDNKQVETALTYIFGVGRPSSQKILAAAQVDPSKRVKELSEAELGKIRDEIAKSYEVEGDLTRQISVNIRRLKEINSYRGGRHKANLPARGQRTKTNARTKRGKRVTMGSGRKKASAKT